jgi:hypothetical protein
MKSAVSTDGAAMQMLGSLHLQKSKILKIEFAAAVKTSGVSSLVGLFFVALLLFLLSYIM